jgi:hypothetical protein
MTGCHECERGPKPEAIETMAGDLASALAEASAPLRAAML